MSNEAIFAKLKKPEHLLKKESKKNKPKKENKPTKKTNKENSSDENEMKSSPKKAKKAATVKKEKKKEAKPLKEKSNVDEDEVIEDNQETVEISPEKDDLVIKKPAKKSKKLDDSDLDGKTSRINQTIDHFILNVQLLQNKICLN